MEGVCETERWGRFFRKGTGLLRCLVSVEECFAGRLFLWRDLLCIVRPMVHKEKLCKLWEVLCPFNGLLELSQRTSLLVLPCFQRCFGKETRVGNALIGECSDMLAVHAENPVTDRP